MSKDPSMDVTQASSAGTIDTSTTGSAVTCAESHTGSSTASTAGRIRISYSDANQRRLNVCIDPADMARTILTAINERLPQEGTRLRMHGSPLRGTCSAKGLVSLLRASSALGYTIEVTPMEMDRVHRNSEEHSREHDQVLIFPARFSYGGVSHHPMTCTGVQAAEAVEKEAAGAMQREKGSAFGIESVGLHGRITRFESRWVLDRGSFRIACRIGDP